jgi:hypothetical protein
MKLAARLAWLGLIGSLAVPACSSDSSSGTPGSGGSGGNGDAGPPGSCLYTSDSCPSAPQFCCTDYSGNATAASVSAACASNMGTYSSDPCDTSNIEGGCTLDAGTPTEKTIYFFPGYTAASSDPWPICLSLGGLWTAPN